MAKLKFAKTDFTEENLPQTRREQFFSILKNQYKVIFIIGLVLLLLFIPSLVKSVILDYTNNNAYAAINAGSLTEQEAMDALKVGFMLGNAIDVVLYPLVFIGLSGLFRVLKLLVYGDVPFFGYDFKMGVKDNIKPFVLTGLFIALFKMLFNFLIINFSNFPFLKIACYFVFMLVLLPGLLICLFYSVVYKNKIFRSLRDSCFLYLRGSWRILILMIIGFAPYIAMELCLNLIWIKQIIYGLLLLFVVPLILLASFMVVNNVFDRAINQVHYPEIVRKGLYVPSLKENK